MSLHPPTSPTSAETILARWVELLEGKMRVEPISDLEKYKPQPEHSNKKDLLHLSKQ